jgi:type VI secretion system secreted protein VgrG
MSIPQQNLLVSLETPLGADLLVAQELVWTEALGRLFQVELSLISDDPNIDFDGIIGQGVTITLQLPEGEARHFHGIVSRFVQTRIEDRYAHYQATVVPWLWLLTRTADCRIFQEKSIPDIITEIFDLHGFTDYRLALSGTYEPWDYCVQYRETAFNFVSRLMEQEGIYYFFEHEKGKHTLVIADGANAHQPFPEGASLPYNPAGGDQTDHPAITSWLVEQEIQPGVCGLNDFNFEKPKSSLEARSSVSRNHAHSGFEIYDYPGEHEESGEGTTYSKVRLEEFQSQHEVLKGESNSTRISAGYLLTLEEYPREDQNREHLITELEYRITNNLPESDAARPGAACSCRFSALDSATPVRPVRITPKPLIQGPQTAIVSGPGGEEIHTDKYGRVKVQFHWDRYGRADENSSCWVRVSQTWAGKSWGTIHIPRIGQEVVIEFLEGDPDRPIITGRVYNADAMPPYALPANKTQSGIKTRSSQGGGGSNFNEIRFEDKTGSEQLFIHAEKNQDIEVENDETHWVGHDRTKTIDNDETTLVKHDRTETVDHDETITIHNNRSERVDNDETLSIGGNRTETVTGNENITIDGSRTEQVAGDETITISGGRTESVAQDESITISGGRTESVGGDERITIRGGRTESVSNNESITISGQRSVNIANDDSLTVGKKLTINAGDEITLTTGQASISMKKDGTIRIQGRDITVQGSGAINVRATNDVVIRGRKVLQN